MMGLAMVVQQGGTEIRSYVCYICDTPVNQHGNGKWTRIEDEFPTENGIKWGYSIAMLVYQRVYLSLSQDVLCQVKVLPGWDE